MLNDSEYERKVEFADLDRDGWVNDGKEKVPKVASALLLDLIRLIQIVRVRPNNCRRERTAGAVCTK